MKALISFFGIIYVSLLSIIFCLTGFINNAHRIDCKQALDMALYSTAKSYFLYEEIDKEDIEDEFNKRLIYSIDSGYEKLKTTVDLTRLDEYEISATVENTYKQINNKQNTIKATRSVKLVLSE